jgi:hypothetical protein
MHVAAASAAVAAYEQRMLLLRASAVGTVSARKCIRELPRYDFKRQCVL